MTTVYRGDSELVHIADGQRSVVGRNLSSHLDYLIRNRALDETDDYNRMAKILQDRLCPGCYMVAIFNAAVDIARANGQSLSELGNSLGKAFLALAQDGDHAESIESIEVQLDSEPCNIGE